MNVRDANGVSRQKSLESAIKQGEKVGMSEAALAALGADLVEPEVVEEVEDLKVHFLALTATRAETFNGVAPITYTELKSYMELSETDLSPWDVQVIRHMDMAFLRTMAELKDKE